METNPAPSSPKPRSNALRIFMIICAVIVLLGGLMQLWKGFQRFRTRNSPQFVQLATESDKAAQEGARYLGEASPLFQQLLRDVDSLGLESVRTQQKETITKTNELFGKSAEQFRLAEKKLDESRGLNRKKQFAPFLATKSQSYDLRAQTLELNQEIIRLLLDDSIVSVDALLPKLSDIAKRRDEMDKKAKAANDEADAIGKRLQAEAKK